MGAPVFNKMINNIPNQLKTLRNNLTPQEWNNVVNILKEQANNNAEAIAALTAYLDGEGIGVPVDPADTIIEEHHHHYGGSKIDIQPTEPDSPVTNQVWYDISEG